jgi:hypothetical protein
MIIYDVPINKTLFRDKSERPATGDLDKIAHPSWANCLANCSTQNKSNPMKNPTK